MAGRIKFGIPKGATLQKRLMDGLIGGGLGGAGVAVSTTFLGPVLGPIVGGTIVGALMPDPVGTIVSVNATMDAIENLLLAGA